MKLFWILFIVSFTGCTEKDNEPANQDTKFPCIDEVQCQHLLAELSKIEEQRTRSVQTGDAPTAWAFSVQVSGKEDLLRLAGERMLSDEDFLLSETESNERFAMTITPKNTEKAAANCLENNCPYRRDIKRLQRAISDSAAANDQIQQLEISLELNYRFRLIDLKSSQSDESSLGARYIVVRGLLSKLKAAFGRGASTLSWLADCPQVTQNECDSLETKIAELRQKYQVAVDEQNESTANSILAEINLSVALLELARSGHAPSSPEAQALWRRNTLLLSILGRETSGLSDAAGTLKTRKPYSEGERGEVERVFREISPLYIAPSPITADGVVQFDEVVAKQHLPWASYWYPMKDNRLYATDFSPLAKLDSLASARGRTSNARLIQRNKHEALAMSWSLWDGHCDAWANAALISPEPKREVFKNGHFFTVSDLKALLILKYAGFPLEVYGKTYRGDPDTDGEIQDIRPEAFHRLVEFYIGEKGQSIGIDDDPESPIWNKPMYSMRWKIGLDPDNKNAVLVDAFPMLINTRQEPSDTLTDPNAFDRSDVKRPKFEYRLFFDPLDVKDGKYRVIFGEWINRSRSNHPDTVFVPKPGASPTPRNADIGRNLDLIDELVGEALR